MPFELSTQTFVTVALYVSVGAAAIARELYVRSKSQRVVKGRVALSAPEFAALFPDPNEAVVAPLVRDQLRSYISVDPALVLPDDKLCADLQLARIDGLEANCFVADVERATATKIPDEAAEQMATLRDIVRYVAKVGRPP